MFSSLDRLVLGAVVVCGLTACGGGGGGGGGRTTETAVRLIHGGIDTTPLEVFVAGLSIQKGAFADVTDFVSVPAGPIAIDLQRANTPGATFRQLPTSLAEETEYSIFVAGSALRENLSVQLLEEPVAQPAAGRGRVQLLNALEGSAALTLEGTGASAAPQAAFGRSSGFFDVPAGPLTFAAQNGRAGTVANFSVTVPDQGELTLVVEGSLPLGAVLTRTFSDLD